jgi:hypothetical protein
MLLMYGQCYHVIRMQLRRPESTQSDLPKDTILGHVSYSGEIDRTGLNILENNKNTQSITYLR